jgi:hypothetical protein
MLPMDANIPDLPKKEIIEEKKIQHEFKYNFIFSKAGFLAGIIKIPPKEERTLSYSELPRTEEDEKKIEDVITSMGIHGKITLLLHHEKRLRKAGDELRYLHPFKFLGYVFSHPQLKAYMRVIFDDYFKRTNFIKDFSQTMDIYDLKNKLTIYIEDFGNEINVPDYKIAPFIKNKDWEGLVRFLINH